MIFFSDLMEGYKAMELTSEENSIVGRSLWAQCQAVADMKFTYVVSCQDYGIQKRSGDPRAQDILRLMTAYGLTLVDNKEMPYEAPFIAYLKPFVIYVTILFLSCLL